MSFDNFNTDVRKRFRERVGELRQSHRRAHDREVSCAFPSGSRNSFVRPICRDATVVLQESGAVYACFTMMGELGRAMRRSIARRRERLQRYDSYPKTNLCLATAPKT
jgi:hypothetical protein